MGAEAWLRRAPKTELNQNLIVSSHFPKNTTSCALSRTHLHSAPAKSRLQRGRNPAQPIAFALLLQQMCHIQRRPRALDS